MKRLTFFTLVLALALALLGMQAFGEGRFELPGDAQVPGYQARPGELGFSLADLEALGLGEELRNSFIPIRSPQRAVPRKDLFEQDFPFFFEVYKFFYEYIKSFNETREKTYPTLSDFRATYLRKLSDKFPGIQVQAETYQETTDYETILISMQGAGGGLRFNFTPASDGTMALVVMPLYGEERNFNPQGVPLPGGTDYILRSSTGVVYRQKIGPHVEPGFQVYFQPQVIDFGQFRVYTEAYIRFKILDGKTKFNRMLRLDDVTLLPKVVFWKSTDQGGLYGDDIQQLLGSDVYSKLTTEIYGFLNIQVHINL